jgi:hypothetical protein
MKQNFKARANNGHQFFDLHFWSGSRQMFDQLPSARRLGNELLECGIEPCNSVLSFLMCELRRFRIRCFMSTALENEFADTKAQLALCSLELAR